jgi:hypothetical protein
MLNRLSRWRERRRCRPEARRRQAAALRECLGNLFEPGETLPSSSTVAVNFTGEPEKVTYISSPVAWSLRDIHRQRRYTRGES